MSKKDELKLTDVELEQRFNDAYMSTFIHVAESSKKQILTELKKERKKNYIGELKTKVIIKLELNSDNTATIEPTFEYEIKEKVKHEFSKIMVCEDQSDFFENEIEPAEIEPEEIKEEAPHL